MIKLILISAFIQIYYINMTFVKYYKYISRKLRKINGRVKLKLTENPLIIVFRFKLRITKINDFFL